MDKVFCIEGWNHAHTIGSLNCKAGICGQNGHMGGIAPGKCQCGGLIHGECDFSTINDTYGPDEAFVCDKCHTNFTFDEVNHLRIAEEQKMVANWNAKYPVGTKVTYRGQDSDVSETKTSSAAEFKQWSALISVESVERQVSLLSIVPIESKI